MDALKNTLAYYGPRSSPNVTISMFVGGTWQVMRSCPRRTFVTSELATAVAKAEAWDLEEGGDYLANLPAFSDERLTDSQKRCLEGDP